MATLLLRDEVHPDDLRAASADTSWELGVSELDHLTYLAPMAVLLGEWPGDANRCPNPSFEKGLSGWAKQLEGGSTVEADYSEGYDDGRSARMTRGTGICWLFEAATRSVSEGWQTVFLRVKGTPGARFVGRLHNYSGGVGSVYGPLLVLDGMWQTYTFSQHREAGDYRLILHLETDGATCNIDTVSIRYAAPVVDQADSLALKPRPVVSNGLAAVDDRIAKVRPRYGDQTSLVGRYSGYPPNLIPLNAGFSHNPPGYKGHPYGWELDIYGGDPVSSHEIVADAPSGVTFPLTQCVALKTSSSKPSVNSASRRFSVVGGKTYRQAGWIRGEAGAANPNLYLGRRWFDASGTAISYSYVAWAVNPSSWTYYEGTVVAPSNAAQCEVWIINYNNTGSTGHFTGLVFAEDTGRPFNQLFLPSGYDPASETARVVTTKETESQVMMDFWGRAWTVLRFAVETLAGSDARSSKPGKKAIDAQAVADVWAKVWNAIRQFAETHTPRDTRWATTKPRVDETASPGDDERAKVGKKTSEVASLVDALTRAWGAVRTFAETHSPIVALRNRVSTRFTETQTVSGNWARTWSAFLMVAQAVSPTDVVRKLTRRTLADLQAATEALASLWTAFLCPGEVLTPADTERVKVEVPQAEVLGPLDTRRAKPSLKVTDAEGLVESWTRVWQAPRQIPDSLGALDALRKTGKSGLSEGLAALDARTVKPGKKASDAVGLVSQLATVWTAFAGLVEALVLGDVRKAKTTRPAQEVLAAGDARTVRATKAATDVVLPQADLAALWQALVEVLESLSALDAERALGRLRKTETAALNAGFWLVFSARRLLVEATGAVDDLAHLARKIAGDLMQGLDALHARIMALRGDGVAPVGSLAGRVAKGIGDTVSLQIARWAHGWSDWPPVRLRRMHSIGRGWRS